MIKRKLEKIIRARLKNFPAVAILGPRQVGKTTLAKNFSSVYFDLELEEEKLRLDIQWGKIVKGDEIVILDEAQNFPEIFPRLRSEIDKNRAKNGRFLILGSISPTLLKNMSEFLTGRIAICELYPFSIFEISKENVDNLWLMGGYPDGGILNKENFPIWQQNYLDLLAMRDLPNWGLPAKPALTKRFFRMLAASHGSNWNASQIGKSLGLSYHTVNTYLDYLEQAFLIRTIPPYHANVKKRLVKRPKFYWRDSGLLHSLMQTISLNDLVAQPWVGQSWEGWIIEQILIHLNNEGIPFEGPYFYRTIEGQELDLILKIKNYFWAIEIKLTSYPTPRDMAKLNKAAETLGIPKRALISRTEASVFSENMISANIVDFLNFLME